MLNAGRSALFLPSPLRTCSVVVPGALTTKNCIMYDTAWAHIATLSLLYNQLIMFMYALNIMKTHMKPFKVSSTKSLIQSAKKNYEVISDKGYSDPYYLFPCQVGLCKCGGRL